MHHIPVSGAREPCILRSQERRCPASTLNTALIGGRSLDPLRPAPMGEFPLTFFPGESTMRTITKVGSAVLLLTIGYVVGSTGILRPAFLFAQEKQAAPAAPGAPAAANALSDDSRAKIKAAADALKAAMEALQLEQRYNPATKGMNAFAILSG